MSNYSQNVFFGPKDALSTGDPLKVIKGTEIDIELAEISSAIQSKTEGDIPVNTRMMFFETAAPDGWRLNTAYNGRTVIISSGPVNDGVPNLAGSWTLSGISIAPTTLTAAQSGRPAFTPVGTLTSRNSGAIGASGASVLASNNILGTESTQPLNMNPIAAVNASASHTHVLTLGGTWRPAYVETIVCAKN
jgi:hypothetical protein